MSIFSLYGRQESGVGFCSDADGVVTSKDPGSYDTQLHIHRVCNKDGEEMEYGQRERGIPPTPPSASPVSNLPQRKNRK